MKSIYFLKVEESIKPAIADVSYFYDPFNAFCITRINVPKEARGKGYGSILLNQICNDADREKVNLILSPEPSDGLNYRELVKWYKRCGFEWTRSKAMMERKPL